MTPVSRISSHFSRGKTLLASSSMWPVAEPLEVLVEGLPQRLLLVSPCAPRLSSATGGCPTLKSWASSPFSAGVNMQTSRRSSSSRGEQVVGVVLVERVHRAHLDLVLGAVHLDHRALALDAVAGLEVVLVLDQRLGAGFDDRVGHRVAHAVRLEEEPAAGAVAPLDVFTSSKLANEHRVPPGLIVVGHSGNPRPRQLRSRPQLDEQGLEVLDDVAPVGQRVRDAGDARAADDRRVGADRSKRFDVVAGLDAEADGDRDVGALAQRLQHRHQRAVVGRPDRSALAVRRDEVDVGRAVVGRLLDHRRLRARVARGHDRLADLAAVS